MLFCPGTGHADCLSQTRMYESEVSPSLYSVMLLLGKFQRRRGVTLRNCSDTLPFGPRPKDEPTFANQIRTVNSPCSCASHQPQLYSPWQCSNTHKTIHQHDYFTRSRILPQLSDGSYEASHLVDAAIQYFNSQAKPMNQCQRSAFKRLAEPNIFHHLGHVDPSSTLSREHMLSLLQIFNEFFFFSALSLDFRWRTLPDNVLDQCSM
jgi:hypothetical protein